MADLIQLGVWTGFAAFAVLLTLGIAGAIVAFFADSPDDDEEPATVVNGRMVWSHPEDRPSLSTPAAKGIQGGDGSEDARIENCRITSTTLGREDHGILTGYVFVEGEGWGCGFGGYAFDQWSERTKRREPHPFGLSFITRVLDTVGVEAWEKLPGTYVRVETEGAGGRILRLGHITKDKWFDPQVLADELRERVGA